MFIGFELFSSSLYRNSISSDKGVEAAVSKAGRALSIDGDAEDPKQPPVRSGMSWQTTSYFLIAQMAGAGFLSLPMALANTGTKTRAKKYLNAHWGFKMYIVQVI